MMVIHSDMSPCWMQTNIRVVCQTLQAIRRTLDLLYCNHFCLGLKCHLFLGLYLSVLLLKTIQSFWDNMAIESLDHLKDRRDPTHWDHSKWQIHIFVFPLDKLRQKFLRKYTWSWLLRSYYNQMLRCKASHCPCRIQPTLSVIRESPQISDHNRRSHAHFA